ncbi:MAG: HAD hydrolase family protein [Ignavibacteria bacterium]|nr:HAD hydrolase family protein [Ignavibacteria bacterium]MBI3766687.1 HAD hydrolase family protein [Ignavibacteriales bacterium]
MVVLDVDGVLTDGRIMYDDRGTEYKMFNAHDGFGIERAQKNGLKLALITGRASPIVTLRAKELGIREVHQGAKDKLRVFKQLTSKYRLHPDELCYMGDDELDLPILQAAGVSAAPATAMRIVTDAVDIVTIQDGGRGAVRELLDAILNAKKVIRLP